MASVGVNVFRYSALLAGVGYGFMHNMGLRTQSRAAQEQHEYHAQEQKIEQARRAWQNKINPPKTEGVAADPESPQFDVEKWAEQQAKAS